SHIGEPGSESSRAESIEHSPLSLTMRNVSLRSCIVWAYGLRNYQVAAPGWLADERYDIVAKTAISSSVPELRSMLQSLLAERFALKIHHEAKDTPVYELVVSQRKTGLRQSTAEGDSEMRIENGAFVYRHTTMLQFAERLEALRRLIDRPVVDGTK